MRRGAGSAGNPAWVPPTMSGSSRFVDGFGSGSVELLAGMMIAHDARREIMEFDEIIGLASQVVRNHRRRGADGRYDRNANTLALNRLDKPPEVAVSGEQDCVIDKLSHLQHIDRQLDVHVTLDPAASHRVGEFLCRLGYHGVAIVIEPIDERSDWRVFLIFEKGGVIERTDQASLSAK